MSYDLFVWLRPDLSGEQVKKEIKDFESQLKPGGQLQSSVAGKRKLAYKIKGFEEGIQLNLTLDCDENEVADLSVYLNRQANVLRYLLTKHS